MIPVVAPKKDKNGAKTLEVCLLLDCTGSMSSWIQRSKDTLAGIIKNIKSENLLKFSRLHQYLNDRSILLSFVLINKNYWRINI